MSESPEKVVTNVDSDSESEDDIMDFDASLVTPPDLETPQIVTPHLSRRFSRNDANSIVGGESLTEPTGQGEYDVPRDESPKKFTYSAKFGDSQKVFSFSLPFGGLSGIRSNLYKQLSHFPNLPFVKANDMELSDIRLRLQRQQSVNTVEEAKYFGNIKRTDDVRFRAVKHSINEMLPDFIHVKKENSYDSIYNELEGNIVIMGGYRGSILRDAKTHKRVWIPLKAGFHLRKINLLLGPNPEDEINATDLIYPDGILKNIGPIDICKKLIKKLKSNPKTNLKEFGYDWRLSLDLVAKQFEKFLLDLYEKTGKPTIVIAHSMGGLIAHAAMQSRPDLYRGLIYVGTPSECLNILGPIRYGDSVILSDKILTFETNFMMRSGFCFLPLSGRIFVNMETGENYDLDYFDPDTWVEYNLNPLVSKTRRDQELRNQSGSPPPTDSSSSFPSINSISSKIRNYRSLSISKSFRSLSSPTGSPSPSSPDFGSNPLSPIKSPENLALGAMPPLGQPQSDLSLYSISFSEAYDYLKRTLKSAKEFVLGLEYKPELKYQYPPLAVVYGNKVPSVRGSKVSSRQDIKDGNYYAFYYGHGDGVVHQRWLMPIPKGFKVYDSETGEGHIVGRFSSDAGHVNLMTDFEAVGKALVAITSAEAEWPYRMERSKNRSSLDRIEE